MLNHAKCAVDIIQGIVLAIRKLANATDADVYEVMIMTIQNDEDKFAICSYCGCEELWPDEMSTSDPTMCDECEREECSHANILREYQGSNDHRVRFLELCVKCKQTREVRLYFHNKYPSRTNWMYTGDY